MADDETGNKVKSFADWQALPEGEKQAFSHADYSLLPRAEKMKFDPFYVGRLQAEASDRDSAARAESFRKWAERRQIKSGDSLIISGKGKNCPCNADRLWLCYDIYDKGKDMVRENGRLKHDAAGNPIPSKIQRQFIKPLDEVCGLRGRWKIVEEEKDDKIQYKARFYRPKSGKCEPTVVFRGTIGDLSGFGVYVKLIISDKDGKNSKTLLDRVITLTDDSRDKNMMNKKTRGYAKRTLLNEHGEVKLTLKTKKGADPIDTSATYGPVLITSADRYDYQTETKDYSLEIIIGASNRTCWGNNIRQALDMQEEEPPRRPVKPATDPGFCEWVKNGGDAPIKERKQGDMHCQPDKMSSAQYKKAAKLGPRIAAIIDAENKQRKKGAPQQTLFFAGHSLGGGLAGCAAHWAASKYPDLPIYGISFNASGLNPHSTPGNYGEVQFFNHYVEDEILTTVQLFPQKIPFLGDIFNIFGGIRLPEPYGGKSSSSHPPLHPCPVMDDMPNGPDRYAEWLQKHGEKVKPGARLPKLWPVTEQTLCSGVDFSALPRADNIFLTQGNMKELVRIIGNVFYGNKVFTLNRAVDSLLPSSSSLEKLEKETQENLPNKWGEGKSFIERYREMREVTNEAEKLARIEAGKIAENIAGKALHWVKVTAAEYVLTNSFVGSEKASGHTETLDIMDQLKECFAALRQLFTASADYHGMDVVAQSIFMPWEEAHGGSAGGK